MICLPSSNFFVAKSQFDSPINQKNLNCTGFARKEGCIVTDRALLLWATYIGERRTTFAKAYGISDVLLGTLYNFYFA
jgi:hypothetical protein